MWQHQDALRCKPGPRLLMLAAGLLVGLCACIGPACAQDDPVEDLQAALAAWSLLDQQNQTDAVLSFRKETLQKKIDRLKTLSQLRRALALEEWKIPSVPVDIAMRKEVADRFVNEVQRAINSSNPLARAAVANLIAEIGPTIKAALPEDKAGFARSLTKQVIQLCKDPDVAVQQEALRALGNINAVPKEIYPVLVDALKNDKLGARRQAAAALSQMVRVVAFLKKRGRTPSGIETGPTDDVEVADAAAAAASFGLEDPDPQVRRLSLEAIDEAAKVAVDRIPEPRLKKDFPPEGRPLTEEERKEIQGGQEIVASESQILQRLFGTFRREAHLIARDLTAEHPLVTAQALNALENIATARIKVIRYALSIPTLGKADEAQRRANLRKIDPMAYFLEDKHLEHISLLVRSPEVSLRRTALEVLELLGEDAQPALPAVAGALGDPDRFNRWAAVRAIGNIGPRHAPYAIPGLANLLADEDPNVRMAASATLAEMGPEARVALPALVRAIGGGNDAEPRIAAMYVLTTIGPEHGRPAVPALIAALGSPDPRVRRAAADVLGKLGPIAADAAQTLR